MRAELISGLAFALVLTTALIVTLPLTQRLSTPTSADKMVRDIDIALPPPPEPKKLKRDTETVSPQFTQTITEPTQLDIKPLDLALNPGLGTVLQGNLNLQFQSLSQTIGEIELFDLGDLDEPPIRVAGRAPRYPSYLQRKHVTGKVRLVFIVNREGRVEHPTLLAKVHPELDKNCLKAVADWRFKPGKKDQRAVRTRVTQEFEFATNR